MVAETLTGSQAGTKNASGPGIGWHNFLVPVYGEYSVAANVEDGDIFEMCYTPANYLCYGGWFSAADIDTGTETLDLDLGWAANGGASETFQASDGTVYTNVAGSASAAGLLNMGVLTGDAVATDLVPAGGNWRPLRLPRAIFFSRPTLIQVEANAAANAFTAGYMMVFLQGKIIG